MTPRGRPRKLTRKAFLKAYALHKTIPATAHALGVTLPTVYNYLRRFKAPLPTREPQRRLRKDLVRTFTGKISIPELALQHGCTPATARYHMRLYIRRHWSQPQPYPKPNNLPELKLALMLRKKPSLFDDPPRLAQLANLSVYDVTQYLERVFNEAAASR